MVLVLRGRNRSRPKCSSNRTTLHTKLKYSEHHMQAVRRHQVPLNQGEIQSMPKVWPNHTCSSGRWWSLLVPTVLQGSIEAKMYATMLSSAPFLHNFSGCLLDLRRCYRNCRESEDFAPWRAIRASSLPLEISFHPFFTRYPQIFLRSKNSLK